MADNFTTIKKEPDPAAGKTAAVHLIRTMTMDDYEKVKALWMTIDGFGIRTIDDSREGVERFIKRNPTTSIVAEKNGEIVGTILCGHDGRNACFYHVCVRADLRRRGIGKEMAVAAMRQLQSEHINKVSLVAYKKNEVGNQFWNKAGWSLRDDLNTYDFILNEKNITNFNKETDPGSLKETGDGSLSPL